MSTYIRLSNVCRIFPALPARLDVAGELSKAELEGLLVRIANTPDNERAAARLWVAHQNGIAKSDDHGTQ